MASSAESPRRDENADTKATATFRKPTNDAGSRKYRRRSPAGGSSSSEGSPPRERKSSLPTSRKDHEKSTEDWRRKGSDRDLDRDSGRSQYGQGGDSYRHSEFQSSRNSRVHHRNDDYSRRDRYADDDDRNYSRAYRHSDRSRKENENHSRDYERDYDKYSRDKSERLGERSRDRETDLSSDKAGSGRRQRNFISEDIKSEGRETYKEDKPNREEKIVEQRSLGTDHIPAFEDSKSHINDSTSTRDSSSRRSKETSRSHSKSLEEGKYSKQEKKNSDARDRYSKRHRQESEQQSDDRKSYYNKDRDSSAKKPRVFSSNGSSEDGMDESVITEKAVMVDDRSTNLKRALDPSSNENVEQAGLTDSDIDAAKLAAIKAAELVNRNLIGTGYMSADQKKKLLWGGKKAAATTEEPGHRWDTTLFGDRERQEKFHKLMGVKGEVKVEHKPDDPEAEKQREQLQLDLEKQYTAGLRRRDGRTVGLGL